MLVDPGAEPRQPERPIDAHDVVMNAIRVQRESPRGAPAPSPGTTTSRVVALVWASAQRPPAPALLDALTRRGVSVDLCADPFRIIGRASRLTRPTRGPASPVVAIFCDPVANLTDPFEALLALRTHAPLASAWWYQDARRLNDGRTLEAVAFRAVSDDDARGWLDSASSDASAGATGVTTLAPGSGAVPKVVGLKPGAPSRARVEPRERDERGDRDGRHDHEPPAYEDDAPGPRLRLVGAESDAGAPLPPSELGQDAPPPVDRPRIVARGEAERSLANNSPIPDDDAPASGMLTMAELAMLLGELDDGLGSSVDPSRPAGTAAPGAPRGAGPRR
jgi:hypothetical protein